MTLPLGLLAKAVPSLLGKGGSGGGGIDKVKSLPSAALGLGTGIIQSIQAKKLKNQSDSAFPDLVDPSQTAFLAELGQKRKSIDTGAAFASGMDKIDATQAGTNEAITRASGGDTGATMQALLQGQRVAGDSKNAVLAQGQNKQMAYDQMYQGVLDQIAARKLQLQMQRSQQLKAEWAAKQKTASQNMMAGIAGFAGDKGTSGNGAFGTNWVTNIPRANTPTPASAGLDFNNMIMGGKADTSPTLSGENLLGGVLPELTLNK